MGRRVMAIVAALLVALLGAAGVVLYAQNADARAVAGQATQQVFIAQAPVPQGTSARDALAQKLIVAQTVVSRGVPAGALTEVSGAVASLVATTPIARGEIVLASRFGQLTKQAAPTGPVPDGQVAITVNLPDPERIAPLLTPGSHIVIYDTFNPEQGVHDRAGRRQAAARAAARSSHPCAVRRRQCHRRGRRTGQAGRLLARPRHSHTSPVG